MAWSSPCFKKSIRLKGGKGQWKGKLFGSLEIKSWNPEVEELEGIDMIGWEVSKVYNQLLSVLWGI